MTTIDLKARYGRCIPDVELAKYFGIDVRTVRKYAATLGGVMVTPGRYWFFENLLMEKIRNAELNHEKRCAPISSKCSYSGKTWQKETKTLPGRHKKITTKGNPMGGKDQKAIAGKDKTRSRHGIF
jgi:hypothetical protein